MKILNFHVGDISHFRLCYGIVMISFELIKNEEFKINSVSK